MRCMGEGRKKFSSILKQVLRPTKAKVAVFLLFFVVTSFLGLYPVRTNTSIYHDHHDDSPAEFQYSYSGTVRESLILVVYYDFHWISQIFEYGHDTEGEACTIITITDYVADPDDLVIWFIPMFVLLYVVACFIGEFLNWGKEDEYDPDVHLWKPWKES